jgi:hypothetical protein
MIKNKISILLCCTLISPVVSHAFDLESLKHGTVPVQLGFFGLSGVKAQNINIQDLIGNQYSVKNNDSTNGLVGIGYYVDGLEKENLQLSYGVTGYYMGKTAVTGYITQEHLFTNLAYQYDIQNAPVYLAAKAKIKNNTDRFNIIFDAGIGPNFMKTSHYNEGPLTNYSQPDNAFTAHNNVAFSAMGGVGIRLNNVFGKAPLECGYRFFYLGQGQLHANNPLLLNTINTGETYANALVCSVNV